jgi:alkylhydroperoxidase/carboxymuconolactone decarboxylase family protein YurZ
VAAPPDYDLICQVKQNYAMAPISDKMKTLLAIAGKAQKDGKQVTSEDVASARRQGATDKEIHDTVLIAAAFCMFHRYVDGLATWQPQDPEAYREIGKQTSRLGYVARNWKQALQTMAKTNSR